jgi:hypothetical protein
LREACSNISDRERLAVLYFRPWTRNRLSGLSAPEKPIWQSNDKAMNRARHAALLAILWDTLQAWFLLMMGYYPVGHVASWSACVLVLAASVALWMGSRWARIGFLVAGSAVVVLYAATL